MNRRDILVDLWRVRCELARSRGTRKKSAAYANLDRSGLGDPTPAEIKKAWAPTRDFGWIEGKHLIVERRRIALTTRSTGPISLVR